MNIKKRSTLGLLLLQLICGTAYAQYQTVKAMRVKFQNPSNAYKPGVYWYFMDGNMSAETIKKDLRSMKEAGIANALFLEVNVGVPRGKVEFLSEAWFSLMKVAINEAKHDGINITLGIGPGWQGSGGPWIKADESTQLIEATETVVSADEKAPVILPVAPAPKPFFGWEVLTDELAKARNEFYRDVVVLAFPYDSHNKRLTSIREKALYDRGSYSSSDTVKEFLSPVSADEQLLRGIPSSQVVDITGSMTKDGRLNWRPGSGKWVVMRFVSRNSGSVTRPSPVPGLGFESDKLSTAAIQLQLDQYVGKVVRSLGKENDNSPYGLKGLHMDSWEVSAQNWTPGFRKEFLKRNGYDPLKYFPVYKGYIVESAEKSERFLWDMRQTTQALIFEDHVGAIKKYAHQHGLTLSIEPYDLNQTSDLDYGSLADIPMGEFWSKDYDFNTSYSVTEASSIAHVMGKPVVQAESFTAYKDEAWKQYPGVMKNQTDWAFAAGVNKFIFHTFENQFLPDSLKPGATMGPFGVHWDRSQTWWPMVGAYHRYLTRCGYLLQQGHTVADILFLTPEGNPDVFTAPASALTRDTIGDRKGFNFDGCTAKQLMGAKVVDHTIRFPSGASYKILILPFFKTMTPALLTKIESLVRSGAIIVGPRPLRSPSLMNYPACDKLIEGLGQKLWGSDKPHVQLNYRHYGKGIIITGGDANKLDGKLYPYYATISSLLKTFHFTEDLTANAAVRYTHRTDANRDIYFLSNTTDRSIHFSANFRTFKGAPELWDANTGGQTPLYHFVRQKKGTSIALDLHAFESCFVIFSREFKWKPSPGRITTTADTLGDLSHDWMVSFDPKWGGPAHTVFKTLKDWSLMEDEGIKYYSGTASYTKNFNFHHTTNNNKDSNIYIDLGVVKNMAHVYLNDKDLGVVWTAPWRVDITKYVRSGSNTVRVDVVNLWANRLIGDENLPSDGPKDDQWPSWLINGEPRPSKRFTFTTATQYRANSPLQPSGLLGPVALVSEQKTKR